MPSCATKPKMLSVVMLIDVLLSDVASRKMLHYGAFIFTMFMHYFNLYVTDFRLKFKLCHTMLDIPGFNDFSPSLKSRTSELQCLNPGEPSQPSLIFADKAKNLARQGS